MSGNRVTEIEQAIGMLTQQELQELLAWLDEYAGPQRLDRRIEADLAAERLDDAVQDALNDERHAFFQKRAGGATGDGLMKFLRKAPNARPDAEDRIR